jgi:hypothetical protein
MHRWAAVFVRSIYDLFVLTARAERAERAERAVLAYSSCTLSGMFIKRSPHAMSFITISQTEPFRLTRLGTMLQFSVLNNAIHAVCLKKK